MEQRKKESGIRLEDVAAGYGRKALLNHISLHVSPGNVLTLIGPNGAGKSTILKTILAGENMGPAKLEKAAKLGVKIINETEFLNMLAE